jgi:tRNA threonylcarbamoyl adenosine modification protein YeaZ
MPQIAFGLEQSNIKLKNLDLVTIANGPGSFTGIRIGLATAKGICMAHEIPLLPINTLELLAYNIFGNNRDILPFIDARMSEVYAALYSSNLEQLIPLQNVKPADFLQKISKPVTIVGDGLESYREIIEKSKIDFVPALPHQNIPLASTLISIALRNPVPDYNFDQISELEPFYLRKSQAEIAREKNRENK